MVQRRAPHHIATTKMTDIIKQMWDVLYDCDKELRTTRPTDPRRINDLINQRISDVFSEKVESPRFKALEAELGKTIAEHGEGISQYGISRAMAHILDRAGSRECNDRFIRAADNTLAGVANRQLEANIKYANPLPVIAKQIETQWEGRLANGLRAPIRTHQVLMGTSMLIGTGLAGKGIYELTHPKSEENSAYTDLPKHNTTAYAALATAEIAAGIAIGKWTLTGKLLPGIHKIRSLG